MAKTVLVLGANGRLGRAATLAFAAAGWQVLAQLRRPPRAALPPAVRLLQCDALDVALLSSAAPGVDQAIITGIRVCQENHTVPTPIVRQSTIRPEAA